MNWGRIMCSSRYHVCAATLLLMMSPVCTDCARGQDWVWWRENLDLEWRGADSRQWPRDNPEIMSRCEQLRVQISWQYSEIRDKVAKLLYCFHIHIHVEPSLTMDESPNSDGAKQKFAFCPPSAPIYVLLGSEMWSEKLLVYCWETVKPNSHHPWDSRYPDNQCRHKARDTCNVYCIPTLGFVASCVCFCFNIHTSVQTPDVTLDTRRMW